MTEPVASLTPQQIADACGVAMYERDYAAQALDIVLEEIAPGYARMRMVVRKDMVNGHDIGHGGMTFALADTAFAYSCNSRNQVTVASACTIDYLNPARLGDTLTAIAHERTLRGRSGIYDITVTNQRGEQIAHFRGRSHRIGGEVVPGLEAAS
jgi:acyl-CoA thioesterase